MLAGCLIFLTVSCGLDVVRVVLDDFVTDVKDPPVVDSEYKTNYDVCEFTFTTKKLDNSTDMGNGYVYYKIYNRYSTAYSQVSNLVAMTEDDNRKGNSFTSMSNTYGYKELHVKTPGSAYAGSFQISNAYHNNVSIRLTNYSSGSYNAHILVDGTNVGVPVRNTNSLTFDFGRKGDNDKLPEETDQDFNYQTNSEPSEDGIYYVALFSVFMMFDDNWESIYSPVHYLGMVAINSKTENN